MLTQQQKEKKRLKKLARRKSFISHKNRNPHDTKQYRAFKKIQKETIGKMQADNEKRVKEESKFGFKVKKFFEKFVPKPKVRQNYQRGR